MIGGLSGLRGTPPCSCRNISLAKSDRV
jgi:hypothetical protein